MIRRPPRSTRTYTLFPSTTLFRSRSYDQVWVQLIRDFLGPGATNETVRYLRFVLIGALNGSVEWFNPNRDSVSDYARTIEKLLTSQMIASRRSEEHTSELQSLMRISYAVFFLKKKNKQHSHTPLPMTTAQ